MSVNTIHTIGQVHVPGSSAFTLNGINNVKINQAIKLLLVAGAGYPDPTYIANLAMQEPEVSFTATELALVLANFGMSGFKIPQTTVYTSADFYLAQVDESAVRTASTAHRRVRISKGMFIPKSLAAAHGAAAACQVECHANYDGTNAPFILGSSVALPSTAAVATQFTLGKLSLNSSEIYGVQSGNLDFGLQTIREGASSEIYATFEGIMTRQPKFKFRSLDLALLSTFGINGTALTNLTWYLQKAAEGATRVAAATAEHIKLTATEGMIYAQEVGGNNNAPAAVELTVEPTFDGTNAIVAINTASAIT